MIKMTTLKHNQIELVERQLRSKFIDFNLLALSMCENVIDDKFDLLCVKTIKEIFIKQFPEAVQYPSYPKSCLTNKVYPYANITEDDSTVYFKYIKNMLTEIRKSAMSDMKNRNTPKYMIKGNKILIIQRNGDSYYALSFKEIARYLQGKTEQFRKYFDTRGIIYYYHRNMRMSRNDPSAGFKDLPKELSIDLKNIFWEYNSKTL